MTEKVKDAYTWAAMYGDDALIEEYDREEGRGFADVDQAQVKSVMLYPQQGGESHCVDIPQGAQSVFFRRRSIEIGLSNEQAGSRPTVHCIGWKRGDEAVYLFIFEDGSTLLSNNLQAV